MAEAQRKRIRLPPPERGKRGDAFVRAPLVEHRVKHLAQCKNLQKSHEKRKQQPTTGGKNYGEGGQGWPTAKRPSQCLVKRGEKEKVERRTRPHLFQRGEGKILAKGH